MIDARERQALTIPSKRIIFKKQVEFYNTTVENCNCSENKAISQMLHIDVPCSHRLYLGATFPDIPELNIVRNNQYEKLEIRINLMPTEEVEVLKTKEELEKEYICETIKFFTHCRDEAAIVEFVNAHYQPAQAYVLNESQQVIELISEGVRTFS